MKPNPRMLTRMKSISLSHCAVISTEKKTAMAIIIPPMVGVPDFLKWVLGPSPRTLCPILSFSSIGITIGPIIITIKNAIIIGNIIC